jgi:S-adenosylmethionine decarboxylase
MSYDTAGYHVIADMWSCDEEVLDNLQKMRKICEEAIELGGATLVDVSYKKFSPQGLTILFLLEESHLSLHTYPEHKYMSFDCYTCGSTTNPVLIFEHVKKEVASGYVKLNYLNRGKF